MTSTVFKGLVFILVLGGATTLGWKVWEQLEAEAGEAPRGRQQRAPAPVEVAPIEQGRLTLRRNLSGSLEATESFVVAARVGGRIEKLGAQLADSVKRGSVVASLDDNEYEQRVAQAGAELVVAQANQAEARSALTIADRTLKRMQALTSRGVESESQLDLVVAQQLEKNAKLEVAKANVTRAQAILAAEEIRLGYTQVTANWPGEGELRVVGERYVDEGETVTANEPLMTIIRLDPITAVVFVAERDYAHLAPDQAVTLTTDAFPGDAFPGVIDRIAPVFRRSTRQARVELAIPNPDQRLKPGMFVRVTVQLATVDNATIVPASAITRRDDRTGIFLLDATGRKAVWHEVTVGIREGDRVQVQGKDLAGHVVTLGQQLIDDGSPVTIPAEQRVVDPDPVTSG